MPNVFGIILIPIDRKCTPSVSEFRDAYFFLWILQFLVWTSTYTLNYLACTIHLFEARRGLDGRFSTAFWVQQRHCLMIRAGAKNFTGDHATAGSEYGLSPCGFCRLVALQRKITSSHSCGLVAEMQLDGGVEAEGWRGGCCPATAAQRPRPRRPVTDAQRLPVGEEGWLGGCLVTLAVVTVACSQEVEVPNPNLVAARRREWCGGRRGRGEWVAARSRRAARWGERVAAWSGRARAERASSLTASVTDFAQLLASSAHSDGNIPQALYGRLRL